MKQSRFTVDQMVRILRETDQRSVPEVARARTRAYSGGDSGAVKTAASAPAARRGICQGAPTAVFAGVCRASGRVNPSSAGDVKPS